MKLIKPTFTVITPENNSIEGVNKMIELAGRTCYKSEDKITETSAKEFVDRMIKSGHGAMLEHGTIYLQTTVENFTNGTLNNKNEWDKLKCNPFTKIRENWGNVYITTNYRVIIENELQTLLNYVCEPTEYHEKRVTVKWTLDRVTGESFLRHRVFSFARESTRYCNYSKDKFGSNITYMIPSWGSLKEGYYGYQMAVDSPTDGNPAIEEGYLYSSKKIETEEDAEKCEFINDEFTPFINALNTSESCYFQLIKEGWKAQQARQVLSFAVHSPLVMTGFLSDWEHFFELRCNPAAHPDAQYLAKGLLKQFHKDYPGKFDALYDKYIKDESK